MKVDKDPRFSHFMDSILPFTRKQEYAYLQEQKSFIDTYSKVKWGVDFDSPNYFAKMYDSSAAFFEGKIRDRKLYDALIGIKNKNPKYLNEYLAKFLNDCTNKSMIDYVRENFSLKKKGLDEKEMMSYGGAQTGWDSLLNANKGKVIYVDFWASWCMPCRKEMPDAKLLQEFYKNEAFCYLYVSIDEIPAGWKEAVAEENLKNHLHNYCLSEAEKFQLKTKVDLSSIPKYILINKKGDIVDRNALRPGDPKLKTTINKLLIQ